MQGPKRSKGMSKSKTGLLKSRSGCTETSMEWGGSGRVGHTEFWKTESRFEVRMENRKEMDTKQGS